MTKEKIKSVFAFYLTEFERKAPNLPPKQLDEIYVGVSRGLIPATPMMAHCKFMCLEAQKFVDADRIEKAMRWLGFLQGFFYQEGYYTLEGLKNHSRPD